MGSGAAWFDADGDGNLDLLLLNGASLPGDPQPRRSSNRFYRNRGDGTFEDRTAASGLAGGGYAMGVASGDIDGDGHTDLFVTHLGMNRLYRNRGDGTFEDVTRQAGVGHSGFGSSAAFFDMDNDGDLDLYVCYYVDLPDPIDRIVCRNPHGGVQYCDVHLYDGQPDRVYRNDGRGVFTDVSRAAGIAGKRGRGLAVICGDVDGDGWCDVIVANDENPNFLWRNNGDGTFTEAAAECGIAYDQRGETIAGMGLDLGDVDGDGLLDLYESGFQSEPNILFRQEAPGFFVDRSGASGIGDFTRGYLSFGLGFLDYNRDGWPDLFVTNGHVIDDVTTFNPDIPYEQRPTLFRNAGGRFEDATAALGTYGEGRYVGRGAAFADYDNDGDVDILVTHNHQRAALLRCESPRRRHWIAVTVAGPPGNPAAFGARVTLEVGGRKLVRDVRAAYSYLCSNDPRLRFGLGDAARVDRLTVNWPGGRSRTMRNVPADIFLTVTP
jgi:hypothetical protein